MGIGFSESLLVFPLVIVVVLVSVALPIATFVYVFKIHQKISRVEERLRR